MQLKLLKSKEKIKTSFFLTRGTLQKTTLTFTLLHIQSIKFQSHPHKEKKKKQSSETNRIKNLGVIEKEGILIQAL